MAVKVDDIELIRSFQAGDPDAFTHVVSQYREPLFRHAMRRLNSVAAAEDAVQETFFRAYRAFERLRDDSRLGPWLHQILANVCIDEANRRRRDVEKSTRIHHDPSQRRAGASVEEQLGLDVDATPVLRALDSLPTSYQQALTMRFVDELSYDEMAQTSGTSEENARARVSRARSAMRVALRGVAAVPVFVLGLTRRGPRSAAALERADQAHRVSVGVEGATTMSKMATTLAPAIETANAVALSAHHSAPLVTKAALGIGAVALATMSTGPERPIVPPPPPPQAAAAEAPPEVDPEPVVTAAAPAPVTVAPTPTPTAAAPVATLATTSVDGPAPAETVTTGGELTDELETPPESPDPTSPPDTTVAPATTIAEPEPVAEQPVAEQPVVEEPVVEEPVVEPAPIVHGGTITVSGLSITPSGPRLDVAGAVTLVVAGEVRTGSFSGRLSIATEPDASGQHRLEGVATLNLDGLTVELRLAGHAVPHGGTSTDGPEGSAAQQPAASHSLAGQFRTSGGDALSLAGGGSFSGAIDPSGLSLQLSP